MKIKNLNLKVFLVGILCFLMLNSFAQETISKELVWKSGKSLEMICLEDTSQIINWGMDQLPFSKAFYETIDVESSNVFILMVSGCSGLPCWNIYVFRESDDRWYLIQEAHSRSQAQMKMFVNDEEQRIVFTTDSVQIGELDFYQLKDSDVPKTSSNRIVWRTGKSIINHCSQDTSQSISYGPCTYKSEVVKFGNREVCVEMTDICSGIYCYHIRVLVSENNTWNLVADTFISLLKELNVSADTEHERIVFSTVSGQVGEFRLDQLDSCNSEFREENSCIEICIMSASVINCEGGQFLEGNLLIRNNSTQTVKLEKSFNLELKITNENGEILQYDGMYIDEFTNLINSNRGIKLKPNEEEWFYFSDPGMSNYTLVPGTKYNLSYTFRIKEYLKGEMPVCCPESISREIGTFFN